MIPSVFILGSPTIRYLRIKKPPNALHHPLRTQRIGYGVSRMKGRTIRGRVHAVVGRPVIETTQHSPTTSTGMIQRAPRRVQETT